MVAPFAGAWIEIVYIPIFRRINYVAPFAGAWIEMYILKKASSSFCRSLRGSVD